MKLLLIILTIYTTSSATYHSTNGYCANGYYSVPVNSSYRIGYSTNYGRGMQSSVNNQYIYTVSPNMFNHSSTTKYNPGAAAGPNRPRRITVYDGNGNTMETPGGANDPEGVYQYDESTGKWYYSPDGGLTWYEYRKANNFWEAINNDGLLSALIGIFTGGGATWRTVNTPPSGNATNWASDPNDPFLDPIGDFPVEMLLIFLLSYIYYRKRKIWKSLNIK